MICDPAHMDEPSEGTTLAVQFRDSYTVLLQRLPEHPPTYYSGMWQNESTADLYAWVHIQEQATAIYRLTKVAAENWNEE